MRRDPEAHSIRSECSGLPSSDADVWDLRLCVLELCLIYCILLLIYFRGLGLFRSCSFVILNCSFFGGGLLIFFIKSVKTGSRLLSVTLPLHKSRSGSVTSTDVCERERGRSLEVRAVRSARKAKYTQPCKQKVDLLPAAMLFIYQQEKSQTP